MFFLSEEKSCHHNKAFHTLWAGLKPAPNLNSAWSNDKQYNQEIIWNLELKNRAASNILKLN